MAFRRNPDKTWDEVSLYEYAIGALGRKMRTVAELKRLMRVRCGKQPNCEAMMDTVVGLLKEQRYLNDSQYAASYSSFRKENEKFGRFRVTQDLKAKGVHGDIIEKVVGAAYEGVNEEQLARDFLMRKRVKEPKDQKDAARVFRALARAGFGTRVAVSILKHWNVDDELISTLEQERNESEEREESGLD